MVQSLTKELVVASLVSETTRLSLQTLLQEAKNMEINRENLSTNYDLLLKLRSIWDHLEKRRKEEDKPDKDRIAIRKAGYDEIMNPIAELLDAMDPQVFAMNTQILLEERSIGAEIKKQQDIREALNAFINGTIRQIIAAPDNKELVRIQKLIGSEKSHRSKYGEYAAIAEDACSDLLTLIDGRKNLISEMAKLTHRLEAATQAADEPARVLIIENMQLGQHELEENAATIADNAFKKVLALPIVHNDHVSRAVKPRTHRWSWRVDDIEQLAKKSPEFVIKEPNTKAINAFMKEKSDELDEYTETSFNGLTIYRKPFYTAINSSKDA